MAMSENPNPARCGNCGAENPPGREVCIECGAPLTISADPTALEGTPEAPDELRRYEEGAEEERPGVVLMGGFGGAPIPVPTQVIDPKPDRPPPD
jgi:uncharacterized OB-fold protein